MSFKVRMIGNEEIRTSEWGLSGCDERISKKPSEKMSFWKQKAPKKNQYIKPVECVCEKARVGRMIENKNKKISTTEKLNKGI